MPGCYPRFVPILTRAKFTPVATEQRHNCRRAMKPPRFRRALRGNRHRLFRADWPQTCQGAEQLGDAPCLADATSGSVRRLSITNLGDLAEAKFSHAPVERINPLPGLHARRIGMVMHAQVGFDKRPEQPRPHRPLMVRRIAGVSISGITSYVSRIR